ncbi:Uu.00g068090.m01.CDS01 [Anthostomella pinea]|uniref:Peptide hydrolase n=1 Tax=Anthostomella pinea TaxID=933095 RepID=A0AAI8VUA4_9PEZI|nr:Uu.00g068090.m01.CDS01 [Anthostomella pinea]
MVRSMLVAALAATSTALSVKRLEANQEDLFTIEVAPGVTQVVNEDEKFALKMGGKNFIDITNHPNLASSAAAKNAAKFAAVSYPTEMAHTDTINDLITKLSTTDMESRLTTFSEIYNRYYKSDTGKQASDWIFSQVQSIIAESGAANASVSAFSHTFAQQSILATIPGQSESKIVVGAHLDSVNGRNKSGRSPGADDDGSGSITTLEAFKALLSEPQIAAGEGTHTLEFHWYAGEEGGLLGSSDVYDAYASAGAVVKAMLQQDMTGYNQAGPMGVIGDYVDAPLTNYVRKVIDAYTAIGYVDSACGYSCSDHASAAAAGYPSAFVIEADFDLISPYIHTADDTLETVSYEHMLEHAKMVVGFAYELTFADL